MSQYPMTARGAQMLRDELNELKTKTRPRIIESIAEAREHGDLKENAEYHAAKEEQAKTESRIIEINDIIARANIIGCSFILRTILLVNTPGPESPKNKSQFSITSSTLEN